MCTLAAMCRYDPATSGEPESGLKHVHKSRLNKAGLQPWSPVPGDPPVLDLLLIRLDALLLPGFSPHCLGITLWPHIFHPGMNF